LEAGEIDHFFKITSTVVSYGYHTLTGYFLSAGGSLPTCANSRGHNSGAAARHQGMNRTPFSKVVGQLDNPGGGRWFESIICLSQSGVGTVLSFYRQPNDGMDDGIAWHQGWWRWSHGM